MTKFLHRPMFRKGGSANEGITSGLTRRQGYENGGSTPNFTSLMKGYPEFRQEYQQYVGERPRSTNLNDFLINFGLDIASRSPQGGLLSTAAASAKDPFAKFQERKMYEDVSKRDEERDLIKSYVDARATQLSESGGRDAFSHEAKQENIKKLMKEAFRLEGLDTSTMTDDEINQHKQDKRIVDIQLQDYIDVDPAVAAYYGDKTTVATILNQFRTGLLESPKEIDTDGDGEVDMTESQYYTKNPDALEEKVYELFRKQYQKSSSPTYTGEAEGGRVGYQMGERVMAEETETIKTPDATMKMSEAVEEDVPETLSYEELRRRLPPEITNDIVTLLSQSGEALTDFAEIQTQVDVDNFNAKYGVNLVLPSEA